MERIIFSDSPTFKVPRKLILHTRWGTIDGKPKPYFFFPRKVGKTKQQINRQIFIGSERNDVTYGMIFFVIGSNPKFADRPREGERNDLFGNSVISRCIGIGGIGISKICVQQRSRSVLRAAVLWGWKAISGIRIGTSVLKMGIGSQEITIGYRIRGWYRSPSVMAGTALREDRYL